MFKLIVWAQILASALALAVLVGVSQATSSPVGAQCTVPAQQGTFAGAPPPFVKPADGSETIESTSLGYACSLRRADGSFFARALFEGARVARIEYYKPGNRLYFAKDIDYGASQKAGLRALSRSRSRSRRAFLQPLASCGGDTRAPYSWTWQWTIEWYLNYNSLPTYLNRDLSETNLRNARIEWEQNQNWCGIADNTTLNFTYKGRTTLNVGQNGVNTVGWNRVEDIGCSSTAVACTLNWYNYAAGWPEESDVRMDTDFLWQNGTNYTNRYDIWHVYAHELGHTSQFGHVDDTSNVMYQYMLLADTSDRLLGRGDANENNAKY